MEHARLFENNILSLACRRHVSEILLSSAFKVAMNEVSQSPDISYFVKFKAQWNNIDRTKIEPEIKTAFVDQSISLSEKTEIISFVQNQLRHHKETRKDYVEFLQLPLLFLGETELDGKIIKIHIPGAVHRARFMARVIYSLKMNLFQNECTKLKLFTAQEMMGFIRFNIFVIKCYLKYWFTCSLAAYAPLNDLKLIKDLKEFRQLDRPITDAVLGKLSNHLWYLGDILVGFAFFDPRIDVETLKKMVAALKVPGDEKNLIRKKTLNLEQKLDITQMISTNTMKFSEIFYVIESDFLTTNPSLWKNNSEFIRMARIIHEMIVVNDPAERGVGLVKRFNNKITMNPTQQNFVLQVAENYNKQFPDAKKSTFINNFQQCRKNLIHFPIR